jgi:hypothetical protein
MTPIQQLMLGAGGPKKKTYLDDVFSTYLYTGSNTSTAYNNGIDLSGEGGLVWIKDRDTANESVMFDTERGATKYLIPSDNYSEATQANSSLTSFNNNGFTLGHWGFVNSTGPYASWTFRKAKGFFDVVTYTGNATARTISHSLGSIPGLIMIKRTDASGEWIVYHKSIGATKYLRLDDAAAAGTSDNYFNDTEPTASVFSIKQNSHVNANNGTYVAYVFAGGESTAATARSVDFDGGDQLTTNSSSDYTPGTSDFTLEYWYNPDENAVDFLVDAAGLYQYSKVKSLVPGV